MVYIVTIGLQTVNEALFRLSLLAVETAVTKVCTAVSWRQVEFVEPTVAILELKTGIIIVLPPAGHCSGVTSQDM